VAESIIERIQGASNLPSLPTVAMQIISMTSSDKINTSDIAKVIQQDPALTAKILQMVNSAMYGMQREISSLNQALVVLGLRTVKVLALSFSLVDTIHNQEEDDLDYPLFWRRSLTTAVGSRLLGQAIGSRESEEVFIAGLLADIGIVAAYRSAKDLYRPVYAVHVHEKKPLVEAEQEHFGLTHATLSEELLKSWNLPGNLCTAVGAHHNARDESQSQFTQLVSAAASIAALFCEDIGTQPLADIKTLCLENLKIESEKLEKVLEDLDNQVKDVASLLSVEVGETINYSQIQTDAAMKLAQLTIEAEIERAQLARQAENSRLQMGLVNIEKDLVQEDADSERAKLAREADESRIEMGLVRIEKQVVREEAEAKRAQLERQAQTTRLQLGLVKIEKDMIVEAAAIDGLTRIANRAAFDKHLADVIAKSNEGGPMVGMLLMDVDHFKKFNDTHGHQAGDEVLRRVAAIVYDVSEDIGLAARYGGEEFAVIVSDRSEEELASLAEKIRAKIEATPVTYNNLDLHVTASVGVANNELAKQSVTSQDLIEAADQNLYRAKEAGRNRVETTTTAWGLDENSPPKSSTG